MALGQPASECEEECGDDEADPKSWDNPQRPLPKKTSEGVATCAAGNEKSTDAEERINGDGGQGRSVADPIFAESAQSPGVRNNDRQRQDEPHEVEAVMSRRECSTEDPT